MNLSSPERRGASTGGIRDGQQEDEVRGHAQAEHGWLPKRTWQRWEGEKRDFTRNTLEAMAWAETHLYHLKRRFTYAESTSEDATRLDRSKTLLPTDATNRIRRLKTVSHPLLRLQAGVQELNREALTALASRLHRDNPISLCPRRESPHPEGIGGGPSHAAKRRRQPCE